MYRKMKTLYQCGNRLYTFERWCKKKCERNAPFLNEIFKSRLGYTNTGKTIRLARYFFNPETNNLV